MKKIISILLISLIEIIVVGCNRDYYRDVATLRNPQYNDVKISKIMVFVPVRNIALQKAAEKRFVKEFSKNGIDAVESYTIFSPLKSYSPQEMTDTFRKNGIDAYMIVSFTNTSASINTYYNTYTTDWRTSGSTNTTLNYFTDTKLFLVNVADPIWEAQYILYDYLISDYDDIGYFARKIVGAYVRDFKKTEHK